MMNKAKIEKFIPYVAVSLIVIEVLLIIGSWIVSSLFPASVTRSILSSEGIRWLLGKCTENFCTPLLVWIIMLAMSIGIVLRCGIFANSSSVEKKESKPFRTRIALMLILAEVIVMTIIMILLAAIPHAILLNVEGNLYPSSFSKFIIPLAALIICICATTYGVTTSCFHSVKQWFDALCYGISKSSIILVFYFIIIQIYYTIRFICL